ncbi:MAG: DUF2236 domain-containing protein [Acidimicrobiia bacterium]|nr:DUF2236 domain-containing protein [Acidimicrobiia bacterium]
MADDPTLGDAAADLPAHLRERFPNRADDGLYGPDSVTWRVHSDPAATMGGVAALLMQALLPDMVRLFGKVTTAKVDPATRGERTQEFLVTTMFGDTEQARIAGEAVRHMHSQAHWTDPVTGKVLRADEPAWLKWTHCTLVWCALRTCDRFGPTLSAADQDRYVDEQRQQAELVGLDRDDVPATRHELETYMASMEDRLAMGPEAKEGAAGLIHPPLWGNPATFVTMKVVEGGVSLLISPTARYLYGMEPNPIRDRIAAAAVQAMLTAARRASPYERQLFENLQRAETHPFGKHRGSATPTTGTSAAEQPATS